MKPEEMPGKFVRVEGVMGVIVALPNGDDIPEGHFAVRYGKFADEQKKILKCRTVQMEYCKPADNIRYSKPFGAFLILYKERE